MKSAKNLPEDVVNVAEVKEVKEALGVIEVVALPNDTMTIWKCKLKPNRSSSLKMKLISKSG